MAEDVKMNYYQRNKEKAKEYYQQHKEKAKEYNRLHKEKQKAYWKKYYEENREVLIQKRLAYAKKHRDHIYEKNRLVYYPRHQQKKQGKTQDPLGGGSHRFILSPVYLEEPAWNIKICPGGTVTFD